MTAPRSTSDDALARDAWLSEALRHAPDADATPPPALTTAILRQSRAAVAARHTGLVQSLLAAWSWLARPPVAAGFASMMLATVVALMWWDRPLEDTLPPRELPKVVAPAATPVAQTAEVSPAPAAEPTPLAQARKSDAPSESKVAARPETPATLPRAQPTVANRAADAALARAPKRETVAAAPPTTPAAGEDQRPLAAAGAAAAGKAATAERAESQRDQLADAVARPAAAPAGPPATAQADTSTASRARLAATPMAAPQMAAAPAPTPAGLGTVRAALLSQRQRWSWQREGAGTRAMTPALIQWLAQLDDATRSLWRPAAVPDTTGVVSDASGRAFVELQLWRDGRLHSTLRLGTGSVHLQTTGGLPAAQAAELTAAVLSELRAALDQATR